MGIAGEPLARVGGEALRVASTRTIGLVRLAFGDRNTTAWIVKPRCGVVVHVSTRPEINEEGWTMPENEQPWSTMTANLVGFTLAKRWQALGGDHLILKQLGRRRRGRHFVTRFRSFIRGLANTEAGLSVKIDSTSLYRDTKRELRPAVWKMLIDLGRLECVNVALPTRSPRGEELREVFEDFLDKWNVRRTRYETAWREKEIISRLDLGLAEERVFLGADCDDDKSPSFSDSSR